MTPQQLIEATISQKDKLNYINLTEENKYSGWVRNFGWQFTNGEKMSLDLNIENDLFLLFVLAVGWSRTGPWENPAFLVTYLKIHPTKCSPTYWLDELNIETEKKDVKNTIGETEAQIRNFKPRKLVSIRKDIFDSLHVLAKNWNNLLKALIECEANKDFEPFFDNLSSIKGLGTKQKGMLMKITLILRELRCQNIYKNIDGGLCCVPDARVKIALSKLKFSDSKSVKISVGNVKQLIKSSQKIYALFGDLYDLPLFALQDLKRPTSYLETTTQDK